MGTSRPDVASSGRWRLFNVMLCAVIVFALSGCGYSELEQEVIDLRDEAFAIIELEQTNDDFFLTSGEQGTCELCAFVSQSERGRDWSKVAELSVAVYPKMEPAAQHYERNGWEVSRSFTQYVPRELPVFNFRAVEDFRRVIIRVNGGNIEVSAWAGPGCTGRDGS